MGFHPNPTQVPVASLAAPPCVFDNHSDAVLATVPSLLIPAIHLSTVSPVSFLLSGDGLPPLARTSPANTNIPVSYSLFPFQLLTVFFSCSYMGTQILFLSKFLEITFRIGLQFSPSQHRGQINRFFVPILFFGTFITKRQECCKEIPLCPLLRYPSLHEGKLLLIMFLKANGKGMNQIWSFSSFSSPLSF